MTAKIKSLFCRYRLMSVAAKATIAYTLASLFTKGLGFITMPIFTRIMTTAEIGEFNTFSSWYSMISVVVSLALSSGSFSLAMFEFSEKREAYSSSVLTLSSISTLIVSAIYYAAPSFWNGVLSLNTLEVTVMLIAFLLIPATEYRMVRLRYEYKYKTLVAISLTNAIGGTALAISAVYLSRHLNFENAAQFRILGLYAALCAMGLANYIYIYVKGKTLFSKVFWRFALVSSIPLIANSFAKHVLEASDRIMITNLVGKSETGIYSTLYTISSVSLIVWGAIEASLLPYIFDNLKANTEHKLSAVVNPLLLVYGLVCILMTLIAPEIVRVLATEEYYASIYIMPPVAFGVFFTAMYNIFGDVLLYYKKTHYIMVSTFVSAVFNVALNYVCIKSFGYFAAAYTTLASYVMLAVMQYIFSRKVHGKNIFDMKYFVLLSVILFGISMLCMFLYDYTWIRYGIIVAFLVAALLLKKKILVLFQTMKKKEVKES
ncbi:MAG: polysaccharide biosynthesis protein [Ruminococcaceae bacterium]|nr:polysaccharide biosynthesis protein [Oscillospiraceae bacterium]